VSITYSSSSLSKSSSHSSWGQYKGELDCQIKFLFVHFISNLSCTYSHTCNITSTLYKITMFSNDKIIFVLSCTFVVDYKGNHVCIISPSFWFNFQRYYLQQHPLLVIGLPHCSTSNASQGAITIVDDVLYLVGHSLS